MKDLLKADGLARSGQVRFAALRQPASMRESLLAGRQIRLGCADDVLAFLRCERVPCKKMLREIAKELGVSLEDMQRILGR